MRRMFEFRCTACNTVTEKYIDDSEYTAPCGKCEEPAKRIVSAVKCYLDPISGDFPGATLSWAKHHEEGRRKGDQEKAEAAAS